MQHANRGGSLRNIGTKEKRSDQGLELQLIHLATKENTPDKL
jgi:hypothetical protein